MSYTPTEWQTGDTITAEKLNNMESGIENANEPFIVTLTPTAQDFSGTLDKTVAEITAAVRAGMRIVFEMDTSTAGLGMNTIRFDGNSAFEYPDGDDMWYSVEGFFVFSNMSAIVKVSTSTSPHDDGYYSTAVYALTPYSP